MCDIWTHYTPWPCNQLPKSYSFMVKYSLLWKLKWVGSLFVVSLCGKCFVAAWKVLKSCVGSEEPRAAAVAFGGLCSGRVEEMHRHLSSLHLPQTELPPSKRHGCNPRSLLHSNATPAAAALLLELASLPRPPLRPPSARSFEITQPRLVHVPITTAVAAAVGRQVSQCYEHYQPDLVVSVHPLMQVRSFCRFFTTNPSMQLCYAKHKAALA